MCWFLKTRLARQKKAAGKKAQTLKKTVNQSVHNISASVSSVSAGGNASGRKTSRSSKSSVSAGSKKAPARGAGSKNTRGAPARGGGSKSKVPDKKQTQKRGKAGKFSRPFRMPDESSTLPSLFRHFKKPKRQKTVSKPTKRFRKRFMSKTSWDMGICDLTVLHDIAEEDEEEC
ncbi:serine-arginine protein 55-like [Montipora capricornis]|uniref:serine-arginine protein 55-like n=1 Tax=Montipora foliosa TaxID=591990 RepID=UPI0035F1E99C